MPLNPTAGDTRKSCPFIVGCSWEIQHVQKMIKILSATRAPVLVFGETGVGKELVARCLHASGPWADQPYVGIDCGALPMTVIESELFGHERGAFTSASQPRTGLLEAAGAGTILLDEISNLPFEAQAKLLRVLEERKVRPIGSNRTRSFEARVIATTNMDLDRLMQLGQFRKDLYFRLNAVTIEVPPLRARTEDIPVLANHFINLSKSGERKVRGISPQVLEHFVRYPWPGNVRELKNCIERALAMGSGPEIIVEDLPKRIAHHLNRRLEPPSILKLQDVERKAILDALQFTNGDRVKAARLLGIGKTTMYRKVKEYARGVGKAG